MFLQRKAIYNLIQLNLNHLDSNEGKVDKLQPWQIENYRLLPTEKLLQRLSVQGIQLKAEEFEALAKSYDTPEELVEVLTDRMQPLAADYVYLLVFELWRRLFPEKPSLSIFCDELDHQIVHYDLREDMPIDGIQDALGYLQRILDENVDAGIKPKEAFRTVQTYCANDLESFLFDYILDAINDGNAVYASELLEGFAPYLNETPWVVYLRIRAEILDNPEEGYGQLEKLIDKADALDLEEEILCFLSSTGNHTLFYKLAIKFLASLSLEEDYKEFLAICIAHYMHLGLNDIGSKLETLLINRKENPSGARVSHDDPALMETRAILEQKVHLSEI